MTLALPSTYMNPQATIENYIWLYVNSAMVNAEDFGEFFKQVYMYITKTEAKDLWTAYVNLPQYKHVRAIASKEQIDRWKRLSRATL